MNLLIKSTTTILATILAAASGVNAGCANDAGPAMGMMAAEEIVVGSDWFKNNCDPMRRSKPPIDAEAECKQFAINYCIGHMSDAVEKFKSICRETPPTYLMNSWANECPVKSQGSFLPHRLAQTLDHTTLLRKDTKLE